jgi:hypothetical protein
MIEGRGQGMTADQSNDQQEELLDFLPEAELLEIPESNFGPGLLSALWQRKATVAEERAEAELTLRHDRFQHMELSKKHDDERFRAEVLFHEKMQEIQDRTDQLLIRAQEEERLAKEHMQLVETRALVLGDGRRAYVDGKDSYRDESGAILQGVDKEEAHRLHEARPEAATWSERAGAIQREESTQNLRAKIEKLHEDAAKEDSRGLSPDQLDAKSADYEHRLAESESKLQALAAQNADGAQQISDETLGGDYMATYGGTQRTTSFAATLDTSRNTTMSNEFTAAAAGQGAPVKLAPATPAPAIPAAPSA